MRSKDGQENYTRHHKLNTKMALPYITIGESLVFPNTIAPVFISAKSDIVAYETAMEKGKNIIIGYLKEKNKGRTLSNTYRKASLCQILQALKLPDGSVRLLVECKSKVQLTTITFNELFVAEAKIINEDSNQSSKTLIEVLKKIFIEYKNIHGKIRNNFV